MAYRLPPTHARIDWSNPIANGLTFAFSCHQVQGWSSQSAWVNAVTGAMGAATLGAGGYRTSQGYRIDSTIGYLDNYFEATAKGVSAISGFTLTSLANTGRLVTTRGNASQSAGWMFSIVNTGSIRITMGDGSTAASVNSATSTVTANTPYIAGFTLNPNDSNRTEIYLDGRQVASGTAAGIGGVVPSAIPRISFGAEMTSGGAVSSDIIGNIQFAYAWSRLLTPEEMRQLAIDPYCFWTWEGK
ncbi:MAG: hypothetical protein EOP06_00555 [Proteobacteria bacterium]|nr:MAG: hypothetical protein EOP06_00555 [Pseudomonadota bacterium]